MVSKAFFGSPLVSIFKLRIGRSPIYIGNILLNLSISCRSPQSVKICEIKSNIRTAITDRNLPPPCQNLLPDDFRKKELKRGRHFFSRVRLFSQFLMTEKTFVSFTRTKKWLSSPLMMSFLVKSFLRTLKPFVSKK